MPGNHEGTLQERCVQVGAEKFQDFISVVKKMKSLNRQSKVDTLEGEVRSLDPVLGRFWSPLPQTTCPFVGEHFALQRALSAIQQVSCDALLTLLCFYRRRWVMQGSCQSRVLGLLPRAQPIGSFSCLSRGHLEMGEDWKAAAPTGALDSQQGGAERV